MSVPLALKAPISNDSARSGQLVMSDPVLVRVTWTVVLNRHYRGRPFYVLGSLSCHYVCIFQIASDDRQSELRLLFLKTNFQNIKISVKNSKSRMFEKNDFENYIWGKIYVSDICSTLAEKLISADIIALKSHSAHSM